MHPAGVPKFGMFDVPLIIWNNHCCAANCGSLARDTVEDREKIENNYFNKKAEK